MALFRHGQSAAFKVLAVFLGFSLGLLPAPTRFQISPALAATPEEDLATAFQLWRTVYFQDAIVVLDGLVVRNDIRRVNALMLRNTNPINFLDGCALTLPIHAPGDAPVGMMVVGFSGEDERVFSVGLALEGVVRGSTAL